MTPEQLLYLLPMVQPMMDWLGAEGLAYYRGMIDGRGDILPAHSMMHGGGMQIRNKMRELMGYPDEHLLPEHFYDDNYQPLIHLCLKRQAEQNCPICGGTKIYRPIEMGDMEPRPVQDCDHPCHKEPSMTPDTILAQIAAIEAKLAVRQVQFDERTGMVAVCEGSDPIGCMDHASQDKFIFKRNWKWKPAGGPNGGWLRKQHDVDRALHVAAALNALPELLAAWRDAVLDATRYPPPNVPQLAVLEVIAVQVEIVARQFGVWGE